MATAALSTGAPERTSTPALTAATNDNDINPHWMEDRRAKLLLASCVAHPPTGKWHQQRYGWSTDTWFSYFGYRFEALTAIRDEIGHKLMLEQDRLNDWHEPYSQFCRQPDVNMAIDAALSAAAREGC